MIFFLLSLHDAKVKQKVEIPKLSSFFYFLSTLSSSLIWASSSKTSHFMLPVSPFLLNFAINDIGQKRSQIKQ